MLFMPPGITEVEFEDLRIAVSKALMLGNGQVTAPAALIRAMMQRLEEEATWTCGYCDGVSDAD